MKLGMALGNFSWPVPASELGATICRLARQADEAGFDSLWVMDHFFQIRVTGNPPESPMPEAYATLGVLAGQTKRIRLGTLVTSVAYRHPGVLVKTVTTLDVLSAGRMYFGVGAGAPFNVPPAGPGTAFEAEGLGIPFPPLTDRFEMLEELLVVAHQMWRGDDSLYAGKHYQLADPGGRRRRAKDAAAGRAVRGCLPPARPARHRLRARPAAQAGRAPHALRGGRTGLRGDREDRRHRLRPRR